MAIEENATDKPEIARPNSEADSFTIDRLITGPIHIRNFALSLLSTLALVVLLRYAQEFFVPLALSVLIAYALNPFVNLLERLRIHRTMASALIVVCLMALLGYGAYALRHQASDVLDGIPTAIG